MLLFLQFQAVYNQWKSQWIQWKMKTCTNLLNYKLSLKQAAHHGDGIEEDGEDVEVAEDGDGGIQLIGDAEDSDVVVVGDSGDFIYFKP